MNGMHEGPKMTPEEACRKVVAGLAAQGWERSMEDASGYGRCRLRGAGGRRCAYGQLLPDDVFARPGFGEDQPSFDYVRSMVAGHLPDDFIMCHDGGHTPSDMQERFRAMFREQGWTLPPELLVEPTTRS